MQVSCTLSAAFHPAGKPYTLRVFLPRRHECQVDVYGTVGEPVQFLLPLGRESIEDDAPLSLWWYMHRELKGDDNTDSDAFAAAEDLSAHVDFYGASSSETKTPHRQQAQPYTARFGVCNVPLKELVEKQRLSAVPVHDARSNQVATLRLSVAKLPEHDIEFTRVDDRRHDAACAKWFNAETEAYAAVLSAASTGDTNVTELPRHEFAAIVQEIGPVPIFAWVYGNTIWEEKRRKVDQKAERARIARLEQLADALTGRNDNKTLRDLEVLNEMVTLQTRATLYVLDTSMGRHRHDNPLDDWTNIRHNPAMFEAGADCEDCALEIVRECTALVRDGGSRFGKILAERYFTCFAIVTLGLGNDKYTYHAVCIQVPRTWMLGSSSSSGGVVDPVLLHEGTSYTTGVWNFESRDCTTAQYEASHIEYPVESICKVPAETVRSNKDSPYGHVISLFCPELLESKGVAQIEVSYQGKHGAPIREFMRAASGVSFKRIEAPSNWKALVRYLMYWMPRPGYFQSRQPLKEQKSEDPVPPRGTDLNCLFRGVDFTDAVRKRMAERAARGAALTVRRIVLPGSGSVLVQCTSRADSAL